MAAGSGSFLRQTPYQSVPAYPRPIHPRISPAFGDFFAGRLTHSVRGMDIAHGMDSGEANYRADIGVLFVILLSPLINIVLRQIPIIFHYIAYF